MADPLPTQTHPLGHGINLHTLYFCLSPYFISITHPSKTHLHPTCIYGFLFTIPVCDSAGPDYRRTSSPLLKSDTVLSRPQTSLYTLVITFPTVFTSADTYQRYVCMCLDS